MKQLSLIIPVYNEKDHIRGTAKKVAAYLKGLDLDHEIIYSDDGSTDGTAAILKKLKRADKNVRLVSAPKNEGKGAALTKGLKAAKGRVVAYIDADMEIDIKFVGDVLKGIEEGFDLCVGSKFAGGGTSKREFRRHLTHYGYNLMVRWILGSSVYDHSCGVKAFRNEVVRSVLPEMKDKKWVWDTEFLVRAQKKGYRVKEIPVHTVSVRQSKVKFVSAVLQSLNAVLSLYRDRVIVGR